MNEPNNEPDRSAGPGPLENLGRKLDERPEVRAAEEALRHAYEQVERARKNYDEIRAKAVEGLHQVRERNFAEIVAATLELVRKHPGPGVLAALACGWFAGRIFRR